MLLEESSWHAVTTDEKEAQRQFTASCVDDFLIPGRHPDKRAETAEGGH